MEKKKKTAKTKRSVLIALCVFLSVVLVCLIGATIYMESMFGLINKKDPNGTEDYMSEEEYLEGEENNEDITGPEQDPDNIDWSEIEKIVGDENVINILLIGQDRRKGEGRARSDAMILCTINRSAKTVTMSSFMRDMYVQIPGKSDNRINASYAMGGMELLNETILKNFGVTIDGNVEVDFSGFQRVIDLVGGIDLELTEAEAKYLNRRGNWDVEDNAGEWSLKAGVNHMNGSQALAFSRIRKVGNGDFGRTNRQRTVLNALIEKSRDMSLSEINNLLREVLPLMTTDMTDKEILGYVMMLFPMLSDLKIQTQQIPADGTYKMASVKGMSVLIPDLKKNRDVLASIMQG